MWWPDEGCHTGTLSLPTAGFLPLPAFDAKIYLKPASLTIGRMICAFGADDVASLGPKFGKLEEVNAAPNPSILRRVFFAERAGFRAQR